MGIQWFIILFISITLLLFIGFKYKIKLAFTGSVLLVVSFSLIIILSFANLYWFDKIFYPAENHRIMVHDHTFYLPLPDDTVLVGRDSHSLATYSTNSSFGDLVQYYTTLNGVSNISTDQDKQTIEFEYNNHPIIIEYDVRVDRSFNNFIVNLN